MSGQAQPFDLSVGVVELTRQLCDIESVSGSEVALADRIETTLRHASHLEVVRDGNTVAARTRAGHSRRIIVAGHIDTVPVDGTLPARLDAEALWGRGTVDMKGGVASQLILAVQLDSLPVDLTWIFYDLEEVDAARNGLGRFQRSHPDWLHADFAVLGEPSQAAVEGGCNGTLRVNLLATGQQAHSARPWKGKNAIHQLSSALVTLAEYEPETRVVDGLAYRESLSAVGVSGGVAGNVIPDRATLTVNFRFAPDRTIDQAVAYVEALFLELECDVVDAAAGARPGLDTALAQSLVEASGQPASPKYGWTDVSRFSELGIPAVNFGPGDAELAHSANEHVPISQLERAHQVLRSWLSGL